MRLLALGILSLLALIQYPLWLGKGGWLRVWELERQLQTAEGNNAALAVRNTSLEAEVRDLSVGTQAIEERARYDLGLVRPDEVFVQFSDDAFQRRRPGLARP